MFILYPITMGQALRRDLAMMLMLLVIVFAAGQPITSRSTVILSDAISALLLSREALRTTHAFVPLPATLELDAVVVVVVVTPELVVVTPVDAGAAPTEGYGWHLVKVLWTQVLPIY
jgi:hypothetical protein